MKIVVLAGGISTERDVSFVSGAMVYRALKKREHEVILLDVFRGLPDEKPEELSGLFSLDRDWAEDIKGIAETEPDYEAFHRERKERGGNYFGPNVLELCQMSDIVFLALHGGDGENGRVQAAFDLFGIRYTGTGYLSSALAMDKFYTKAVFEANKILAPKWVLLKKEDAADTPPMALPCVVKVTGGGSSVGVFIPETEEAYKEALKEAFQYEDRVLVEEYIAGRELTDCVIDGKPYPAVEIEPKQGFYDYKNKYQAGSAIETCPAPLTEDETKRLQEAAVAVYNALGMRGYARMDFRMSKDGQFYCLEANTLPGLTPTSLVPQEAAAVGMSFEDLCEHLIKVSM